MLSRREAINGLTAMSAALLSGVGSAGADVRFPSIGGSSDWCTSPDAVGFEEFESCFSKGLRHGADGCPPATAYAQFCNAVRTRDLNFLESMNPGLPWIDPLEGSLLTDGSVIPEFNAQWFDSNTMLSDIAELYWASLCRDIPFGDYLEAQTALEARAELEHIDDARFSGPLFRANLHGASSGGYISQFLLKPIPLNSWPVPQRMICPGPSGDFLTGTDDWLNVQDGALTRASTAYYLPEKRYIFNGRALAEYVRNDYSFQAYLSAGLILQSWGRRALNPGLPARYARSSMAFVNNGWPEILSLVAQASQRALSDAWFWKWRVFRRLRPEELAGRCTLMPQAKLGGAMRKVMTLRAVESNNRKFGGPLLSQSYPEGAPLHPSFPAAHAEIAGACVTILKAFTDPECIVSSPVRPSADGLELLSQEGKLTVEGELNKLAWNVAFGRAFAGIHYRSDHTAGLRLGEQVALGLLNEKASKLVGSKSSLWLRRFDGTWVNIKV